MIVYWEFSYLPNLKSRVRGSVGCQRVVMPELGSRLSTYKMHQIEHLQNGPNDVTDQAPTPCVPVASPRFKPKGALPNRVSFV